MWNNKKKPFPYCKEMELALYVDCSPSIIPFEFSKKILQEINTMKNLRYNVEFTIETGISDIVAIYRDIKRLFGSVPYTVTESCVKNLTTLVFRTTMFLSWNKWFCENILFENPCLIKVVHPCKISPR